MQRTRKNKVISILNDPIPGQGELQMEPREFDPDRLFFDNNEFRKLVIIGSFSVGKTSLASRIVHDDFSDSGKATIGVDQLSVVVELGSRKCTFQVWDTSGDERYSDVMSSFYRGAEVVIICYDCTRTDTFQDVDMWKARVDQYAHQARIFLVACKTDMPNKEVSSDAGITKASSISAEFFEVSAKEKRGVLEMFQRVAYVAIALPIHSRKKLISIDNSAEPLAVKKSKC